MQLLLYYISYIICYKLIYLYIIIKYYYNLKTFIIDNNKCAILKLVIIKTLKEIEKEKIRKVICEKSKFSITLSI